MKKFLCMVLTVFALCLMLCGAAFADAELANSMEVGTWTSNPRYITFGKYNGHDLRWRVLEVYGDKTAFLVLDDVLRNMDGTVYRSYFDRDTDDWTNNFPASEIYNFLNGTFLSNFTDYQAGILETSYGPDGYNNREWYGNDDTDADGDGNAQTGKSKIFLLSVGEVENPNYFRDDVERGVGYEYWLRSPGYIYYFAAFVSSAGQVFINGDDVYHLDFAVRPAFILDLSSEVFTSALAPVSYPSLVVRVKDKNGNPISGAKVSLSPNPTARSAENFLGSGGVIYFNDKEVAQGGSYTITVSKPGYETQTRTTTASGTPLTITLEPSPDPAALIKQNTVTFGKYGGKPIIWRALDTSGEYALLLADEPIFDSPFGSGIIYWSGSSLRTALNKQDTDGFLAPVNFNPNELDAIKETTITENNQTTNDHVFLLNREEALRYLPDSEMRKTDGEWWLRTMTSSNGTHSYIRTVDESGGIVDKLVTAEDIAVRPAMWVNMTTAQFGYPPVPGGPITANASVADASGASVTLTWPAASDIETAQTALKYYVYKSVNDNIRTIAACEQNGGSPVEMNGTAGKMTYTIQGVPTGAPYYFNVVVMDGEGYEAAYKTVRIAPVTGVKLVQSALTLTAGGAAAALTAAVEPSDAGNKTVLWTTSAPAIAAVSPNGVVTPIAAGTAIITATTEDGGYEATCDVTVNAAPVVSVISVSLNKTELSLEVGESETLIETVYPSNATNQTVIWTSNNDAIATVSNAGLVAAEAAGTAVITVKTADGGYEATCTVTVGIDQSNKVVINNGPDIALARDTSGEDDGLSWSWSESAKIFTMTGNIPGGIAFTTNQNVTISLNDNAGASNIVNNGTGSVTISGAEGKRLTLNATDGQAIQAFGNIVIDSGEVYASTVAAGIDAIASTGGSVTISGTADVEAISANENGTGNAISAALNISISTSANVKATTKATTIGSYSLKAQTTISIKDGGTTDLYFTESGSENRAFIPIPVIEGESTIVNVNGHQYNTDAEIPNITADPQDATVGVGKTRELTVTAEPTDAGTLSYQWYSNTTNSTIGSTKIPGATDAAYTPPTTALGTTYYYVVVTNTNNMLWTPGNPKATATSNTAEVTVNELVNAQTPNITAQPESASVDIDTPLALTVTANAPDNGTLTYQWYSNTRNSNNGGAIIQGARYSTYTVPTGEAGTYYYYVVVTNTIPDNDSVGENTAETTSAPATITVNASVIDDPDPITDTENGGGGCNTGAGMAGITGILAALFALRKGRN